MSLLAPARDLRHVRWVLGPFLVSNRATIIARAQARVASRPSPRATAEELTDGIPMFLDQLGAALRLAKSSTRIDHEQISASAGRHGLDLLRMGLTIAQVVHDYGDVCQVVTELAVEQEAPISSEEFRTLNLCLDDAIAGAVTAYAGQREHAIADRGNERLGVFAHELRNVVNTALLSFDAIKSGRVAVGGSTALLHARSLMRLRDLVDGSLAVVRLDAGVERHERIAVADLLGEVEIAALVQAQALGIRFTMTAVEGPAAVEGDRQLLVAALSNLLQNAFKFTREHGGVSLSVRAAAGRVLFDIEDECGGLPPGKTEELFRPFEQRGANRSGLGLGLSICLETARAHGGEIRVRDLPGTGCVFTLDLPAVANPI